MTIKTKDTLQKIFDIITYSTISFENISTWQKHLSVLWSVFPCQYAIVEYTKKTFTNVHDM